MSKILIVDDEDQIRKLLARMLELEGYEIYQAADCKTALSEMKRAVPDVVLCDVFLPAGNGVDFVVRLKKEFPMSEVILLTAHGNISDGVQAIKNGAFDYITKGDDNNRIIPLLSQASEKAAKNKSVNKEDRMDERQYSFDSIIGSSCLLSDAVSLAKRVSMTDVPVLLTGETGTGKEVFAQAIHKNSLRNKKSFVAVNCSAVSKELLESEMFGYKAGAFTGALKDKKGLFEEADNGTIFLDEIGEMAYDLQAKLLRILESGEYIKIGETKPTKVNVRVIAATNRDLVQEIENGSFREDLFYRLSVFRIQLPALREHPEDIPLLADSFIRSFAEKLRMSIPKIDSSFYEVLCRYTWKGNVRELRNVIERSMIVCNGEILTSTDLPIDIQQISENKSIGSSSCSDFELASIEKLHIIRVLEYTKGNKTEAARLLKIGLTTLYRKIEEYGL